MPIVFVVSVLFRGHLAQSLHQSFTPFLYLLDMRMSHAFGTATIGKPGQSTTCSEEVSAHSWPGKIAEYYLYVDCYFQIVIAFVE